MPNGDPYPTGFPPRAMPMIDQPRWQTCPVCLGRGTVAASFYSGADFASRTANSPVTCKSCFGRGIVR